LWLGLLLVVWICMTVIGKQAVDNGDIDLILHPVDYQGRSCGVGDYEDKPDLYYVRFDGTGVCVESCPQTTDTSVIYACVDDSDIPSYLINGSTDGLVNNGYGYCMVQYATSDAVGYCIFSDSSISSQFSVSSIEYLEDYLQDIYDARWYIIGLGFGLTLVLSYVFVLLLHVKALIFLLIWGAIWAVFLVLLAVGASVLVKAEQEETVRGRHGPNYTDQSEAVTTWALGAALVAAALLWACYALAARSSVRLAAGIVHEAAAAVAHMPLLLCLPLFQIAGWVVFVAVWAAYLLFLLASGDFETVESAGDLFSHEAYQLPSDVVPKGVFLGAALFWTSAFVVGLGLMMTAQATAQWYFTRDKQHTHSGLVCGAVGRTLCHHVGTAAFGSLFLSLTAPFRWLLVFIDRQVTKCGSVGKVLKCCCCLCTCCIERCLNYLSKGAYAHTAIFSHDFLQGGREAFNLVARNVARVTAVSVVCDYILLIMVGVVTASVTALSYAVLMSQLDGDWASVGAPMVVILGISLFVAWLTVELLGMAMTTVQIAYLADMEMFRPGDRFVSKDLKQYMDDAHRFHLESTKGEASNDETQGFASRDQPTYQSAADVY